MTKKQIIVNALIATGFVTFACGALVSTNNIENIVSFIILFFPIILVVSLCISYIYRDFRTATLYICGGSAVSLLGGVAGVVIIRTFFPNLGTSALPALLINFFLYVGVSIMVGLLIRTMIRSVEAPVGEQEDIEKYHSK